MSERKGKRKNATKAGEPEAPALRHKMAILAAATGAPAPGDGREVPAVSISQQINVIASACGKILHAAPLFKFAGDLATVNDAGEIEPMPPERFCSWAENHLCFTRDTKDGPQVASIGKDHAGKILRADSFRAHLRELRAVYGVRLPVWRGEGKEKHIELAPAGFDPATGIFTRDAIQYAHDWSLEDAKAHLVDMLGEFPFEIEGEETVWKRRSFAATVAGMLSAYALPLIPEGVTRCQLVFNANQSGSGKSLLARLVISPAHGLIGEGSKPKDDTEMRKLLTTAAFGRKPFFFLDDVANLHSHPLNAFITSPTHEDRVMNSQMSRSVPKITQVIATGNALTVTPDLERRSLLVDLFEPGDAEARSFKREITSEFLALPETRARSLAALWAICHDWDASGRPTDPNCRRPSFETWSAIVGNVAMHAGFANPFSKRLSAFGGDESGRALVAVLAKLAGQFGPSEPPTLTPSAILEAAEEWGYLEVILPYEVKNPKNALGHRIRKLKGRQFLDTKGRLFEFGRRDKATGAVYPIRYLGNGSK